MMTTTNPPVPRVADRNGLRATVAAVLAALAIVPIILTPFPPSTDLPQHLAQVRLLREALAEPSGPYVVQWAGPNNLLYALLAGLAIIIPDNIIPRAILVLVVLSWMAAIYWLALSRRRQAGVAALASILVFSQPFYWGFLNFVIGFPIFILWFTLTEKASVHISWKKWLGLAGTAFLLYESHVLWLGAGVIWLVLLEAINKTPLKATVFKLTSAIPSCVLAALWYPRLSGMRAMAGFDVGARWSSVFDRLGYYPDALFGGLRGPVETMAFVLIYLWIVVAIYQGRKTRWRGMESRLLAAALFFLVIVLLAPDKYMNTVLFASRWLPVATIFLLFALPQPSIRRIPVTRLGLAVAVAFFIVTAVIWVRFNAYDLKGFEDALECLPPGSRVLGLDLLKESDTIKGRPFLQLTAYAQAFKSCTLNFSFAEHYSGLVSYKKKREVPWTPGLEWCGEKVKRADFRFFDFVLIDGDQDDFNVLESFSELKGVVLGSRWRLYEVIPASNRSGD